MLCGTIVRKFSENKLKNSEMTTDSTKRPDFLCWVKNFLIFKDQEKANANELDITRNKLVDKFAKMGSSIKFYTIVGS
ncbi:22547_t:CDS:2 [Gigaspora rosea]|nr:22547_t:CDS:2 [Gigaspora rosea]